MERRVAPVVSSIDVKASSEQYGLHVINSHDKRTRRPILWHSGHFPSVH